MQLKKTSKKKSLINEVRTFSNGYFSFNNIDEFISAGLYWDWLLFWSWKIQIRFGMLIFDNVPIICTIISFNKLILHLTYYVFEIFFYVRLNQKILNPNLIEHFHETQWVRTLANHQLIICWESWDDWTLSLCNHHDDFNIWECHYWTTTKHHWVLKS